MRIRDGSRLWWILSQLLLILSLPAGTRAQSAPPVARIAAVTTVVEGDQPLVLSGAASTDDVGIASYTWLFPTRRFAFSGDSVDRDTWIVSDGVIQNRQLVLTGTGVWTNRYFFSSHLVQRGSAVEGWVETPPSSAGVTHCMVGFKNRSLDGNYPQFHYALYFNNGILGVYEDGTSRGSFNKPYLKSEIYYFRIETLPGAGARYFYRHAREPQFNLLFESTALADADFRFGATVHSGTWGFDDWELTPTYSGPEVRATAGMSGQVILTVTDGESQSDATALDISVIKGNPPVAAIEVLPDTGVGLDLLFSGSRSKDDFGVVDYEWDFGDGTSAGGEKVVHCFESPGTYNVTLTVSDYAGQTGTTTQEVQVRSIGLVRAVPWRPGVPHDALKDTDIRLKAVASTAVLPIVKWTWDFGDGSEVEEGIANTYSEARAIEASHKYSGADQKLYFATITIIDGLGAQSSDTYPIIVQDPDPNLSDYPKRLLQVRMRIAIDEGLWYLHKTMIPTLLTPGIRGGFWPETYTASATGSAVQAFEVNGHLPSSDPLADPYLETVSRGLNHLFAQLVPEPISRLTFPGSQIVDPDTNENGIGLGVFSSAYPTYELGQVMDAFVAAGIPELTPSLAGIYVSERSIQAIFQDCMDRYFGGQHTGSTGGGWRYSWGQAPDNSASQWAAIGCIPGQDHLGISIPPWVKANNLTWLCSSRANNGFGYTGPGSGPATTPAGMVQLAMDDILPGDEVCCGVNCAQEVKLWENAENYLSDTWGSFRLSNNYYAYYTLAKAMWLARPERKDKFSKSGLDWLNDPQDGLALWIVDHQNPNGGWSSSVSGTLSTAWAVVILTGGLFTFVDPSLTVEVDSVAMGRTTPPPGKYFLPGKSNVPLVAIPRPGYVFLRWEGNVQDPASPSTSITISTDQIVKAFFAPAPPVSVEGRILTTATVAGEPVVGADVWLYSTLSDDPVAQTASGEGGAFRFGEELSLRLGWYRIAAAQGTRSGRSLEFLAVLSPTAQDVQIDESPLLGLLSGLQEINLGLKSAARLDNAMLADMSRLVDSFGDGYNGAQDALQIANLIWDGLSVTVDPTEIPGDLENLARTPGIFRDASKAVSWTRSLLELSLNVDTLRDLIHETPETQEAARNFLKGHLAVEYGGLPFEGGQKPHLRSVDDYESDGITAISDSLLEGEMVALRQDLAAAKLDPALSLSKVEGYLSERNASLQRALDRWGMDSQILLFLPESYSTAEPLQVPLLLRPTYLDYFKSIAKLKDLFLGKTVVLGINIASDIAAWSGAITGPAATIVITRGPQNDCIVGLQVGGKVTDAYIEGLEMETRAHLTELWGRSGPQRVEDLANLPRYLESIRGFLGRELSSPYYFSANTFSSSIEEVDVKFPPSRIPGIPDTKRLRVKVLAKNQSSPARTVILARNYANDWLNNLFQGNPSERPSVLFPDWSDLKVNSLTDAAVACSPGNLPTGGTFEAEFELVTGVGFLASTFDLQETVLSVQSGPFETSVQSIHYNLWRDILGTVGGGGVRDAVLGHGGGEVTDEQLDAWLERVEKDELVAIAPDASSWTTSYVVPQNVVKVRLSLRESAGAQMALLVTDSGTGKRIGFLPEEGREVREADGVYSGPVGEVETLILPVVPGTSLQIRVTLLSPGPGGGGTAQLVLIAEPVRPAILAVTPAEIEIHRRPDEKVTFALQTAEAGRQIPLNHLRVDVLPLTGPGGVTILPNEGRLLEQQRLLPGAVVTAEPVFILPAGVLGRFTGAAKVSTSETGERSILVTVVVDAQEPETTLTEVPEGVAATAVTIRWEGSDDFTPTEKLRYEVSLHPLGQDAGWSAALERAEIRYDGLQPGTYEFSVRAVDLAGNMDSTPATASFLFGQRFQRGDTNADGKFDISDPINLLDFLFLGGIPSDCHDALDIDDNGVLEITDAVRLLTFLFTDPGMVPAAPYPDCGLDTTQDVLDCVSFPKC